MIDYLLTFPDEATAHAVLDALDYSNDGQWDESRVLPVQVIVGQTETGPVTAGGYWLAVSLGAPSNALYALPYCMREASRDRAEAGEPYVIRERFTPEQLAAPWQLDRQWCGCDYSNPGNPPVISE